MSRIPIFLAVLAIVIMMAPAAMGSPGYKIAYESEIEEDVFNIYTTDGSGAVHELAYENGRHPSLTTEGTVFFTKWEETVWGDYWKSYYISYRGIEGITSNTIFTELDPTVSRNGRYIVFTSFRADTSEIIFEPLNVSEPTVRITTNNKDDVEPAIDGEGRTIYYAVLAGDESYIYRVGSDGYGQERLSATSGLMDRHPSISADNRMLAFSSERDGNSEIYVMNMRTRDVTRLTNDDAWDGHPCISSDGKWIVFSSDRDDNSEIYMIGSDGNGLARLTENEIPDDYPSIN